MDQAHRRHLRQTMTCSLAWSTVKNVMMPTLDTWSANVILESKATSEPALTDGGVFVKDIGVIFIVILSVLFQLGMRLG